MNEAGCDGTLCAHDVILTTLQVVLAFGMAVLTALTVQRQYSYIDLPQSPVVSSFLTHQALNS